MKVKEVGYIEIIFGCCCLFLDLVSLNWVLCENVECVVLNVLIQGSVVDIMKIVLLYIYDDFWLQELFLCVFLQIYDEFVVEVVLGEWDVIECIVCECMGDVVMFFVLFDVQVGCGCDWNEVVY